MFLTERAKFNRTILDRYASLRFKELYPYKDFNNILQKFLDYIYPQCIFCAYPIFQGNGQKLQDIENIVINLTNEKSFLKNTVDNLTEKSTFAIFTIFRSDNPDVSYDNSSTVQQLEFHLLNTAYIDAMKIILKNSILCCSSSSDIIIPGIDGCPNNIIYYFRKYIDSDMLDIQITEYNTLSSQYSFAAIILCKCKKSLSQAEFVSEINNQLKLTLSENNPLTEFYRTKCQSCSADKRNCLYCLGRSGING